MVLTAGAVNAPFTNPLAGPHRGRSARSFARLHAISFALVAAMVTSHHQAIADELPVGTADEPVGQTTSVRDGVFTATQARRGQAAYTGPCSRCHGYKLDGAPDDPDMLSTRPLAGPKFLRDWNGRSLAALFEYTRATMPENNPSYLSDQEYVDVIAYMLSVSGLPAGTAELAADPQRLARAIIVRAPKHDLDVGQNVSAETLE